MALSKLSLGTVANDGTGDDLRSAGTKINAAFDAVDALSLNTKPNVFNWKPASQLKRWRAASGKVRDEQAGYQTAIAAIGDSTTAGYLATVSSINARAKAYPAQIARHLSSVALPVTTLSFFSNGNQTGIDSRVTLVAGGSYTGAAAFGGGMLTSSASGDGFNFIPGGSGNFDRIDVHYMDFGPAFTVAVNSGTAQTVTPGTTQTMKKATLTFTSSVTTSTINVRSAGTGGMFVSGIRPWNSTTPSVEILNGGVLGYLSATWTGTGTYGALQGAILNAPSLTIVNIGINDAQNDVTAATYKTNIGTIIAALQAASSDVILAVPTPCQATKVATAFGTMAAPGVYTTALMELATQYDVPLVNLADRYVSWTTANSLGQMADSLHPNGVMHTDEGAYWAELLRAV